MESVFDDFLEMFFDAVILYENTAKIYLENLASLLYSDDAYLAMADPVGSVNGSIGVLAGFTITVPSTKGANPGRNLFWYERKIKILLAI